MPTRVLVTALKYIFTDGLGGHLDEVLAMASDILRQPSGLEMVMALLRYITRSDGTTANIVTRTAMALCPGRRGASAL